MVVDGIITGVGGVLVFLPGLFVLYLFLTFLEDSGYMARVAFLMDKLMSFTGLQGKSFIPLILGFGCAVPAIYATRTLENERDRIATGLLVPLMSCSARSAGLRGLWDGLFPAPCRPADYRPLPRWRRTRGGRGLALFTHLLSQQPACALCP